MKHAKVKVSINKIKTMQTKKITKWTMTKLRAGVLLLAAISIVGGATAAHADVYDEQINALNGQNAAAQGVLNGLETQASGYQDAINQLQAQINAMQAAIGANQAKQAELQQQIADAEAQIAQQKQYLGEDIKTMYVDGQLSTIEELATSKNLSEYVDKQTYRTSVQNKIDATIREIADLEAKLQKEKTDLDTVIASLQQQNAQLSAAQSQQQQMLAYNESQQSAYNSQISANSSRISDLRRQQIAANSRFIGSAGSGAACGGGYPAKWCEIAQDSVIDNWGMYNRECVSYTAFRVAASGRFMPYWGGVGNANQWPGDARAAGIPVDSNPRVGDVAISMRGAFGHAMYVESVNGDGTISVSQYNASLDGRYSTRSGLDPSGLYFIHF
jgi:surface antigen